MKSREAIKLSLFEKNKNTAEVTTFSSAEVKYRFGTGIASNHKALFHDQSNGRFSTYLWTVPHGISIIYITAIGGGGSGSYGTMGDPNFHSGRGGCGAAGLINIPILVSEKEEIIIIVGSGGQSNQ